jgi:hypothetical protein
MMLWQTKIFMFYFWNLSILIYVAEKNYEHVVKFELKQWEIIHDSLCMSWKEAPVSS